MRKKILAVFLCLCLFCGVAACNGAEDNDRPGEKITLTFWNPLTGADSPEMRALVNEFNREHTGEIEVVETFVNETAHYENLISLIPQNKGPDVALVHSHRVQSFAFRQLILPLESNIALSGIEIKASDYIESVFDSLYFNGKLYGIPLDVHMAGIYYNKGLLDGRLIPTNRAELIAAAKAVQSANKDVYGLPLSTAWPSEWLFTTALYQNGGEEIDADGYPAFNTEAGAAALNSVAELIHTEKLSPTKLALDQDLAMFKQGKALFHIQGSWMLESIKQAGFEFGIIPLSRMFNNENVETVNQIAARSHTFVACYKRRISDLRKAAIIKFVKWMGDHSASWAKAGQIPASNIARATDEFKAVKYVSDFGTVENLRVAAASPYFIEGFNPVFSRVTSALENANYNAVNLLTSAETEARKLVKEARQF